MGKKIIKKKNEKVIQKSKWLEMEVRCNDGEGKVPVG